MDDPVALKALFRRAKAHEGLGDANAALADYKRVVELQPENTDAADEVCSTHSCYVSFFNAPCRWNVTDPFFTGSW